MLHLPRPMRAMKRQAVGRGPIRVQAGGVCDIGQRRVDPGIMCFSIQMSLVFLHPKMHGTRHISCMTDPARCAGIPSLENLPRTAGQRASDRRHSEFCQPPVRNGLASTPANGPYRRRGHRHPVDGRGRGRSAAGLFRYYDQVIAGSAAALSFNRLPFQMYTLGSAMNFNSPSSRRIRGQRLHGHRSLVLPPAGGAGRR